VEPVGRPWWVSLKCVSLLCGESIGGSYRCCAVTSGGMTPSTRQNGSMGGGGGGLGGRKEAAATAGRGARSTAGAIGSSQNAGQLDVRFAWGLGWLVR
jgi:hypothetical protein